eukprot:1668817-Rhodomonas_salina.2
MWPLHLSSHSSCCIDRTLPSRTRTRRRVLAPTRPHSPLRRPSFPQPEVATSACQIRACAAVDTCARTHQAEDFRCRHWGPSRGTPQ